MIRASVFMTEMLKAVGVWVRKSPVRIYLISLALAALPLSVFVVGAHRLLMNQVRDRVVTQGSQSAKTIGRLLEQDFSESTLVLNSIATRPLFVNSVAGRDYRAANLHLEQVWGLRTEFASLRVYDLQGTLRVIHPMTPDAIGTSGADQEWFSAVRSKWEPVVSPAYQSKIANGAWVVAIAVPIKDQQGKPIGILVAPKSLDKLTSGIYGLLSQGTTTNLSFIDDRGHKFGKQGGRLVTSQTPTEVAQFIAEQKLKPRSAIIAIAGQEYLIAYSPLRAGWGVLLQLPISSLQKALWDYEKNLVYLGLFILLVAAGGGAFVASLYKQLRDTEQQARLVVDQAHDALILLGKENTIIEWNRAAEEAFGWNKPEVMGKRLEEVIVHPSDRPALLDAINQAVTASPAPRVVGRAEAAGLHKDGHQLVIEFSIGAVGFGKDRILACFARDISAKAGAERLLRQAYAEISDLYDNAPVGYYSLNEDGVFLSINETALSWLGYTKQETVRRLRFEELLDDRGLAVFRETLPHFRRSGTIRDLELALRTKDGNHVTVLISATAVIDENGAFVKSRSTMIDISKRKLAEIQVSLLNDDLSRTLASVEALNQDLESFTYSVSHDLRGPLRHLDGFARILEEDHGPKLDEDARHCIRRIRMSATHMGSLVDDLLGLARLGRLEPDLKSTGLRSLVDKVISDLENEQKGRNIEWKIGDLPFVECDPSLVRQVFANLLSNALKYTRPKQNPVIEITALPGGGGAHVICVRDNGVGFNMKYAGKLFGVFERLHRQEDFEGTGIGLATVQKIVRKHGGRVWAEAELNKGAAFYFTITPPVSLDHVAQAEVATRRT